MNLCLNPSCNQPQNSDNLLFCQSCGSELLVGGQYRVVKLLSKQGGLANIYEATHKQEPRVIKVLKSDNIKAIELFEREFEVLSSLNCPGVPHVYDLFFYYPRNSQQALYCLSMDKIEGINLEEYIKILGQPIDQKTAINWLTQLTQILEQIHSRRIFHRDIKPSNIILQPDGQLVLIDFGAVKQSVSKQGQLTCIYTPGYAAAEQERGVVSAQSDFFSLGRTFVYLLTTKEPTELYALFTDGLVESDRTQNISPQLLDLIDRSLEWRERTRNTSPQFLDLIDRLMAIDPQQRPDTTATILSAISGLPPQRTATTLPPQQTATTPIETSTPELEWTDYQFTSQQTDTDLIQKLPQSTSQAAVETPKSAPSKSSNRSSVWLLPLLGLAALSLGGVLLKNLLFSDNPLKTGQYFSAIKDVPSGEFKFGGSTTWATTRQSQSSLDAAIQGALPLFRLVYTAPDPTKVRSTAAGKCPEQSGSHTGICMLIEGDLDFAQSSVSLEKSQYADRVKQERLQEIPVAYDAIAIVVNPQLKISSLTIPQLRDIYTGTVTNWDRVGGPKLPIVAFSRDPKVGGTVSSFQNLVLGKDTNINFNVVRTVKSPQAGLEQVKTNPGAIYFGAAKEVIVDFCDSKPLPIANSENQPIAPYQTPLQSPQNCQQGHRNNINIDSIKNQQYPLTRKIYVIFKADGARSQTAGEAYAHLLLTEQGQDLLQKAGFVSINH